VKPNEHDRGPYRVDLLLAIWKRIARTADALWEVGAIKMPSAEMRKRIALAEVEEIREISIGDITTTLRMLALQDGMHAGDWLRMKAVEASLPRRKPPPAVDLQIRLRGLNCKRLVAKIDEDQNVRVTIWNTRGDVASVQSESFANALDGAIQMAGARSEEDDHEADHG
jgi:hypothetical protein